MSMTKNFEINTLANSNFKGNKGVILAHVQSIVWREELAKVDKTLSTYDVFVEDTVIVRDPKESKSDYMVRVIKHENNRKYTVEQYLDAVEEKQELEKALADVPTLEEYQALNQTDRLFLLLNARINSRAISLPSAFVPENIGSAIREYYAHGKMSDVKNALKNTFNLVFNKDDGTLFYGIKLKKSDFDESDIRKFLGRLIKPASIKLDKKSKEFKGYDWTLSTDRKSVTSVMAEFFTVEYVSRELTVVKPDTTIKKSGKKEK